MKVQISGLSDPPLLACVFYKTQLKALHLALELKTHIFLVSFLSSKNQNCFLDFGKTVSKSREETEKKNPYAVLLLNSSPSVIEGFIYNL